MHTLDREIFRSSVSVLGPTFSAPKTGTGTEKLGKSRSQCMDICEYLKRKNIASSVEAA